MAASVFGAYARFMPEGELPSNTPAPGSSADVEPSSTGGRKPQPADETTPDNETSGPPAHKLTDEHEAERKTEREDEPMSEPAGKVTKHSTVDTGLKPRTAEALDVPVWYGAAASLDSMTGIAAPLLTAAAITVTGVVVQQPNALRWPGVSLLLLTAAATLLVGAVQFGFLARRHAARPDEMSAWWTELDDSERKRRVRRDREDDAPLFAWWADLARWAYGLGVIALWAGVGSAVAPGCGANQEAWRWVAAGIAWLTVAVEIAWLVAARWYPSALAPRTLARKHYKTRQRER